MRRFGRRLLGAALLDADTYEEVEADRASIRQALLVVAAAALAGGTASFVMRSGAGLSEQQLAFQVTLSALEPVVLWIGGSAFAFMVGATFFRGPETETDFPEVLRTVTGDSASPGIGQTLYLLGREETLQRVQRALDYVNKQATA